MSNANKRSRLAPASSLQPFPPRVEFESLLQEVDFHALSHRSFVPNKYMDEDALKAVGLWEEVDMYLKRCGWEKWALLRR